MLDERDALVEALTRLGDTLTDRELRFHVAIVGGAALLLTGQISRPTQDVDVAAVATDGARSSTKGPTASTSPICSRWTQRARSSRRLSVGH